MIGAELFLIARAAVAENEDQVRKATEHCARTLR
jgi:hypothetical protein